MTHSHICSSPTSKSPFDMCTISRKKSIWACLSMHWTVAIEGRWTQLNYHLCGTNKHNCIQYLLYQLSIWPQSLWKSLFGETWRHRLCQSAHHPKAVVELLSVHTHPQHAGNTITLLPNIVTGEVGHCKELYLNKKWQALLLVLGKLYSNLCNLHPPGSLHDLFSGGAWYTLGS